MKEDLVQLIEEGEDLGVNYQHEAYEEILEDLYLTFTTKSALFFKALRYDPLEIRNSFDRIEIQSFDLSQLYEILTHLKKAKCYFEIGPGSTFWSYLHPLISKLSKGKFEQGYYADAVETSLKEINCIIKEYYRNHSGTELDGAALMNKVFSVNNPVLQFADLSTETGRNIQQGYMQIFAGAMIGIRNPKAHNNMDLDENKAMHLLFIASFMALKVEELGLTQKR